MTCRTSCARSFLFLLLVLFDSEETTTVSSPVVVLAFSLIRLPLQPSSWTIRRRRHHHRRHRSRRRVMPPCFVPSQSTYNYLDTISSSSQSSPTNTPTNATNTSTSPSDSQAEQQQQLQPQQRLPSHRQYEERDIESLSVWALDHGVLLAPGIQVNEDSRGDWSVSITEPCQVGTPIITIPSNLILSSDFTAFADGSDRVISTATTMARMNDDDVQFLWRAREYISKQLQRSFPKTKLYLPEFLLAFRIMYESYLGDESRWYAWIQALPSTFSTGLYFDPVELKYCEQSTSVKKFLTAQHKQFSAFSTVIENLLAVDDQRIGRFQATSASQTMLLPADFRQWLAAMKYQESQVSNNHNQHVKKQQPRHRFDDFLRWTFTVVFTRSWRTTDAKHAIIVPLGDMINHHSQSANLRPYVRPSDDALELCLIEDVIALENTNINNINDVFTPTNPAATTTTAPTPSKSSFSGKEIYLSYGLTHLPARFLVVFGFCDVSAEYVDAHLDFIETGLLRIVDNLESKASSLQILLASMFDRSRLVISTKTGAVSQEVWLSFLYQFLQQDQPSALKKLEDRLSEQEDDSEQILLELLDDLLLDNELAVAENMRNHFQQLLQTDYQEMVILSHYDLENHLNLQMIANYYAFMRETFNRAIHFIDDYMEHIKEIKKLEVQ